MKKILVAEDDAFLSSAYKIKLAKSGFEVVVVGDGQAALDALATFQPDLVILDLIMPVKDGFAVLQELRANPQWSSLPVLVASNLGQKEDIDKAKALGANDFVIKSDFQMKEIVAKIGQLLLPKAA